MECAMSNVWSYQGTNARGEFRRAEIFADTREEAEAQIKRFGITIMSLEPKGEPHVGPALPLTGLKPAISEPPVPQIGEAEARVASTIEAMVKHVPQDPPKASIAPPAVEPRKASRRKQVFVFHLAEVVNAETQKYLERDGKVIHMAMHPDFHGRLHVAMVIDYEETSE
jgi:hypothetical protein